MGTTKVGVYRKYHGPIPLDGDGRPLPKSAWMDQRPFSWAVRWFGTDGQRYSKSFKTRKLAERFAEKKQAEVRQGKADPPRTISLEEFAKEHKRLMPGQVATETLSDQMRALRMFTDHVGRNVQLRTITPRQAESFVAARLAAKVRAATVNKDIRTLKRIFNVAIEPRRHLAAGQNPFASIKQRKQSTKPIRYVTGEEFAAVLAAAPGTWWKALMSVLYTTAVRREEAMNLTWDDVDFKNGRIRVVRKEAGAHLSWEPKDHEWRLLPVPKEVIQLLASLKAEVAEDCPYVFVPDWRWNHIRAAEESGEWHAGQKLVNNLNRRLATLQKKAKVKTFTFHDLRRTCITNWAGRLPIHVVQKLAGHSDIKTTQKYYLSVQDDDLEKARQVQSEILNGNPTDPKLTQTGQKPPILGDETKKPAT